MASSSNSRSIALSSDPETPLTLDQRNAIYSALISHGGLRNIEEVLKHEFQASGYLDDLRTYTNHLLRTGQATSIAELQAKVLEKVREHGGTNGTARTADSPGKSNGVNGTTNGNSMANGTSSANTNSNAHKDPEDYNLAIPRGAIVEGARTVRRELEKVADITPEGEDNRTAECEPESTSEDPEDPLGAAANSGKPGSYGNSSITSPFAAVSGSSGAALASSARPRRRQSKYWYYEPVYE